MTTNNNTINDSVNDVPTQENNGHLLTEAIDGIPAHIRYSMGESGGLLAAVSQQSAKRIVSGYNSQDNNYGHARIPL